VEPLHQLRVEVVGDPVVEVELPPLLMIGKPISERNRKTADQWRSLGNVVTIAFEELVGGSR
jgi:hypothetical protein